MLPGTTRRPGLFQGTFNSPSERRGIKQADGRRHYCPGRRLAKHSGRASAKEVAEWQGDVTEPGDLRRHFLHTLSNLLVLLVQHNVQDLLSSPSAFRLSG